MVTHKKIIFKVFQEVILQKSNSHSSLELISWTLRSVITGGKIEVRVVIGDCLSSSNLLGDPQILNPEFSEILSSRSSLISGGTKWVGDWRKDMRKLWLSWL